MVTRLQLMKVHTILAAFIFPVALMFMITGALYTWGIKGGATPMKCMTFNLPKNYSQI